MQRPNTFLICSISVFTASTHSNARLSKQEADADDSHKEAQKQKTDFVLFEPFRGGFMVLERPQELLLDR